MGGTGGITTWWHATKREVVMTAHLFVFFAACFMLLLLFYSILKEVDESKKADVMFGLVSIGLFSHVLFVAISEIVSRLYG